MKSLIVGAGEIGIGLHRVIGGAIRDVEPLPDASSFDICFPYNDGYKKLGNEEYVRPVLQPLQKRIGGYCVEENYVLLRELL